MSTPTLTPFVPNDYRKRVLAAVERRGGPDASDAFELYDIPLESAGALPDDAVAARIDEVWAFWQKHRDHPKYRVLVGRLVAEHDERSAPLRFAAGRAAQAGVVSGRRELREAERYRLLDNAIERLQDRYGGVPASKRAGLDEVGAMGGLSPDEVAARLRRYRIIDDDGAVPTPSPVTSPVLTDRRLEQIDELLNEFNRLRDGAPASTLAALLQLSLDDVDDRAVLAERTEILSHRARELGAGRFRAVIDELLVHVREILLADPTVAAAYAEGMTARIADFLRPRIRAAVLVEDQLLADDQAFLLQEAIDRGAGPVGAARLIASIAAEFGVQVRVHVEAAQDPGQTAPVSHRPPRPPTDTPFPASSTPTPATPPRRDWAEPLRAARSMLREGRPVQARSLLTRARRTAGADPDAARQIEAVADEVDRAVGEAQQRWQQAMNDAQAGRHVAALESLEWLTRTAADIDILRSSGPRLTEALDTSRRAVTAASAAVDQAGHAAPEEARRLLDAARQECVDHPGLAPDAPAGPGAVGPAGRVSVEATADGAFRISWLPSSSAAGAKYRVRRQAPDGRWQTVGRTTATELEDGGSLCPGVPVYEVTAIVDGRYSEPVRSDAAVESVEPRDPALPAISTPALPDIRDVAATVDRVRFGWPDGVTEAMVVIRANEPPTAPDDPNARSYKVTITRYEIDGGFVVPGEVARPCHVAVASCRRDRAGQLVIAPSFGASARAEIR